jgi:hypothetical protein
MRNVPDSQAARLIWKIVSTSGEHGLKSGFNEDAGDFLAFITLNFNLAVFHGAANATGFLHLFGEHFFFGQADADKIFHDGDGFAAAVRGLPENIHAAAILWAGGTLGRRFVSGRLRLVFRSCGQPFTAQVREGILTKTLTAIGWHAFFAAHGFNLFAKGIARIKNPSMKNPSALLANRF